MSSAGSPSPTPRTVLVVDDVPEILAYIGAVLHRYTAHRLEIHMTSDAKEGLAFVRARAFDLVIADFLMPDVSGIEILQAARERNPTGSRVLITGFNEVPAAADAIAIAQIHLELKKPIAGSALRQMLEERLG